MLNLTLHTAWTTVMPAYQHAVGILTQLMSALACYLICTKTLPPARRFARYTLILQILISLVDINFGLLACPIGLYPIPGGLCLGILCTVFGFSGHIGVDLMFFSLAYTGAAIICCFHFRYSTVREMLRQDTFLSKHRKKLRVFLIVVFTLPCVLITRIGFVISDGGSAFVNRNAPSLYYLFGIPSLHAFAYDTELDPSGTVTFVTALFFALATGGLVMFYCAISTFYSLARQGSVMSEQTRRLQRRGMLLLVIQTLIPAVIQAIPFIIYAFSMLQYFCSEDCALDLTTATLLSNNGTSCSYQCTAGGGTMSNPCTSTTSTTTPITTPTTTKTTTLPILTAPLQTSGTQYFCSEDCVMDLTQAVPLSNNGTMCSYQCTAGGGTISSPCTSTTSTTTPTTTVFTTTPTATTTSGNWHVSLRWGLCIYNLAYVTRWRSFYPPGEEEAVIRPANAVISGPCASIIKNGTFYANKCVTVDQNATCTETGQPTCACSIGYSGTTCGVADAQLKALENLLGGTNEAQQVLQDIADSKGSGGSATLISNLPALLSFLTDEQRVAMSYSASDVIAWATYEGKALNVNTDFTRIVDPTLGNCFTFNYHNSSFKYKIRRVGSAGGLRVEMDSMPDEYAPWTDVVGASFHLHFKDCWKSEKKLAAQQSMYVHPVGQELNVESNKYASIAGSADQLVLSRSMFHKIKKGCAKDKSAAQSFYMDGIYTVDGCLRACYQDSVFADCGCMDSSYARKPGVAGCKYGKLSCISDMINRRLDPVSWKECHCPQPCDEETYEYIVSRATHLRIDNANLTKQRSEVVLFFDSFQTRVSQEIYRISFSQVIGNIGGVAGLLLGITISFIVEVFLLFVMLCMIFSTLAFGILLKMKERSLLMLFLLSTTFTGVHTVQYFCSEECVMDLAQATPSSNNGQTCSYQCPSGGGTMTNPCTTTSTTTTTVATTTTPVTTTPPPATAAPPTPGVKYFCSEECVMDITTATLLSNNGTACSYSCPTGGGTMTSPCTTTTSTTTEGPTTTTTTEATTTTETTTMTPAPTAAGGAVLSGPCASIIKDGILYPNMCVIVDQSATCEPDPSIQPTCKCSIGYSGTTCGVADAQLKALEELLGGTKEAQQVLQDIADSKGSGGSATLISNLPALLSFLTDEQRIAMSYAASEVIAWATYEGKALNVNTDFTRIVDPTLGNCFTFNYHNSSFKYKIRRVGSGGGLRVELDSMPDEYAPWTDVVGMTVYVHPVGQELNVESNKYASIAGSADQLVLDRSLFHKIKKGCAKDTSAAQSFYMDGIYTVDGCLRACYQDSVFRDCGCMDASYARKPGVAGCKYGKLSCIANMVARRADPVSWKECHCPQPCDEETFDYIVSRATHLRIDNANLTKQRSEVVLFFDSFQTKVSQEVYKISFSQVIGNIGGVAGLLLGITISFIVEVVLLFVMLCICSSSNPEPKPYKSA
ncbi:hypothetical protein PRIPAC_80723 [Pristionchus pacificus]|uniref:G protein-coupled receptor n=1 Tax=Pristionchus pacificus TaxID=54126 RepID=A0A2A6CKC6_PRIPA|nr:hypothetical protein PRIPAC_80723 [Pristionchus pacificus]|eukprot:PDM78556.1 G protein-coupled receptor [Pristionchus pacificus]